MDKFSEIPQEDRRLLAQWALKTARTEELTGQQVMRLLRTVGTQDGRDAVLLHAQDEFTHASLYGRFADELVGMEDHAWLRKYAEDRSNFRDSKFTWIFRVMDSIPMCGPPGRDQHRGLDLFRFYAGLFMLDLAGLMTVNVYEEAPAPFDELHEIALRVREDESRHVQFGRDYLLGDGLEWKKEMVGRAVGEMGHFIEFFFGNDDSPLQVALAKYGIRSVPNSELKAQFRTKVVRLLRIDPDR